MTRIAYSLLGLIIGYAATAFIAASANPFDWTQFGRIACLCISFYAGYGIYYRREWSRK